jgi:hypothetical protein
VLGGGQQTKYPREVPTVKPSNAAAAASSSSQQSQSIASTSQTGAGTASSPIVITSAPTASSVVVETRARTLKKAEKRAPLIPSHVPDLLNRLANTPITYDTHGNAMIISSSEITSLVSDMSSLPLDVQRWSFALAVTSSSDAAILSLLRTLAVTPSSGGGRLFSGVCDALRQAQRFHTLMDVAHTFAGNLSNISLIRIALESSHMPPIFAFGSNGSPRNSSLIALENVLLGYTHSAELFLTNMPSLVRLYHVCRQAYHDALMLSSSASSNVSSIGGISSGDIAVSFGSPSPSSLLASTQADLTLMEEMLRCLMYQFSGYHKAFAAVCHTIIPPYHTAPIHHVNACLCMYVYGMTAK